MEGPAEERRRRVRCRHRRRIDAGHHYGPLPRSCPTLSSVAVWVLAVGPSGIGPHGSVKGDPAYRPAALPHSGQ